MYYICKYLLADFCVNGMNTSYGSHYCVGSAYGLRQWLCMIRIGNIGILEDVLNLNDDAVPKFIGELFSDTTGSELDKLNRALVGDLTRYRFGQITCYSKPWNAVILV